MLTQSSLTLKDGVRILTGEYSSLNAASICEQMPEFIKIKIPFVLSSLRLII